MLCHTSPAIKQKAFILSLVTFAWTERQVSITPGCVYVNIWFSANPISAHNPPEPADSSRFHSPQRARDLGWNSKFTYLCHFWLIIMSSAGLSFKLKQNIFFCHWQILWHRFDGWFFSSISNFSLIEFSMVFKSELPRSDQPNASTT